MTGNGNGSAPGSYEQLMTEVRRLCAEGSTGTLFIATDRNEAGQLGLRNGVIVAARFRLKTGLEAVRGLAHLHAARFTFMKDLVEAPDPRNPLSSAAVLAVLAEAEGANGHGAAMQSILISALTEYLGPMASIVVRDQLRDAERTGRGPVEVVEALARGIEEPAAAASFKTQVSTAIAARFTERR